MAQSPRWTPWHRVVKLRDDVRTGELSLADFAADLHDVVMQKGARPVYEDPERFFALTYPTLPLRDIARDVALRLAGRNTKAIRQLEITYGGGKTHTLVALRHLAHDPENLLALPAVAHFRSHIDAPLPAARVAALCFDKLDVEKGMEVRGPAGESRWLKHPWSVLAFQIAGADGLRALHPDGANGERDTPPAEPLLVDLLSRPQADGLATLVLIDEVLMYAREKAAMGGAWRNRLIDFFQYLCQATVKVDRCALVASLLASDPAKSDETGRALTAQISNIFNRQREEGVQPVQKQDLAEVLRRRFFSPESIGDPASFRPHVTAAVANIARIDDTVRKDRANVEKRFLEGYPFHPDLTDIFYTKWTQLDGFQRTRGILRTFAIALRDAERWDTAPLVGANVFLPAPGETALAEAARELAGIATREATDRAGNVWDAVLEGELDKARTIQRERPALRFREMEQAVCAAFLGSQPIGRKTHTPELVALVGATRPDRIEIEKGLRRWTELSWFLDEAEFAGASPDGADALPRAWRLGNRPNLRQMHHDACRTRVAPESVEDRLVDTVAKLKSLTRNASAAGARVHNLPDKPGDVQDDGEFHYAVLGPAAASESGKPGAVARRFIDETTGPDKPRVRRNAVVLAVPSRDGLDAARTHVRAHLGWLEVRALLKDQAVDAVREQRLASESDAARKRMAEAIRQAWSIVVAVNENNAVQAFKVTVGDEPLFNLVKADRRARIQETAVSSEAMMPGGPYDLWREGETARRVKDLVGAFAELPNLPKMLRRKGIMDTVIRGVEEGIWVARAARPDRSFRTFWQTPIDESVLRDPGLEVALPDSATLTGLAPDLLAHGRLPGLWPADAIAVADVAGYFAGGRTATVPREGYDDTIAIPKCEPAALETAIGEAVEQRILWLRNGPASIFGEPVPAGVLAPSATLRPPPEPIAVNELAAESIPDAWSDGTTNALAIYTALSAKRGATLPWLFVRDAIAEGIRARWIEVADAGAPWPSDFAGAQHVVLRKPGGRGGFGEGEREDFKPKPKGALVAEATLLEHDVQELNEQIPALSRAAVGHGLKFHVRVEFGEGETRPDPETVKQVNALLAAVSEDLKLK